MYAPVDLTFRTKISFVAIVLPLLATIGGIMRILGQSQKVTLAIVVPTLFVAFAGWQYIASAVERRRTDLQKERDEWALRDARLQRQNRELVTRLQRELKRIRTRQQEEQERLLRKKASDKELRQMMDRHREEYEALLRRQSA